jgi:hypothetical protein
MEYLWKTQHGDLIPVDQLGDNHCRNILNMLVQNTAVKEKLELVCHTIDRESSIPEIKRAIKFYLAMSKRPDKKKKEPVHIKVSVELNGDMANEFNATYPEADEMMYDQESDENYHRWLYGL